MPQNNYFKQAEFNAAEGGYWDRVGSGHRDGGESPQIIFKNSQLCLATDVRCERLTRSPSGEEPGKARSKL